MRRGDLWRRGVFLLLFTTQELGVVKKNITTSLPHSSGFLRKKDQQGINLLKENETIAHCQTPYVEAISRELLFTTVQSIEP